MPGRHAINVLYPGFYPAAIDFDVLDVVHPNAPVSLFRPDISMTSMTHPAEDNQFLAGHIALFRRSLLHWTGRDLVNPRMTNVEAARYLFSASFALLSHDTQPDPVFNYANQTALSLFAMSWEEMTSCPSRLSAEWDNQADRARLLQEVTENGYSEGYRGIRIGKHGRRFEIEEAVVWNLLDERGVYRGQVASFRHWKWL
jgi:hypothetical protein